MNRPTIDLTQGLPAAGKTTLARKIIANADRPIRYVGLDSLRGMLDGDARQAWWAPGIEASTQRAQAALVAQLVADGADVLVDGTHVYPAQVEDLRSVLAPLPVCWRVHTVATPIEVCIARDVARQDPVGEACIRDLAARWTAAEAAGWQLTAEWLAGGGQ